MHFVFFVLFLFHFSSYGNLFSFVQLWNVPFLQRKQNAGAGINILMSISDGLGPPISCRKREKAHPMREEMDGRVVCFPPESAF